jgi:DNA polymerase-3 subunit delta'
VDEVRRLKSFLGLTAAEGTWRVVIVDTADELNLNAANALLKSLEEPPVRALFLLIASEPSRLLPTIRSRCRRLDLAPLTGEALRKATESALSAAGMELPDAQRWPLLERLAEGSVRRALQLADSGGLELYERIESLLAALPQVDWPAVHTLVDQLSSPPTEQRFEGLLRSAPLDLLARLVRARAAGHGAAPELALAQRLIPEARLPAGRPCGRASQESGPTRPSSTSTRKALMLGTFSRLEPSLVADAGCCSRSLSVA